MTNNLVKKAITKVIKQNTSMMILLFITVCGVVLTSLVPPQILRLIIDNNLVPKNSDKLLTLAIAYLGVLLFIGVFNFMKAALLTILGQKITLEIRMEMMLKLENINAQFLPLMNQAPLFLGLPMMLSNKLPIYNRSYWYDD